MLKRSRIAPVSNVTRITNRHGVEPVLEKISFTGCFKSGRLFLRDVEFLRGRDVK